jgi:hypothetical protein
MYERLDTVVHTRTDTTTTPAEAERYLARHTGRVHILVLVSGDRAVVLTDLLRPWSYLAAEAECRRRGYDTFAAVNTDGTRLAGRLTGTNRFEPIHRRHLVAVA